ncbi:hypothetical protein DV454_003955 [Geotrichum candidum]|nr:hypothetical protein DV454_003955 [Geotrichum candidum]
MSTTTLPSTVNSITFDRAIGKLVLFGDSITQRCYSLDEGRYDLTGPLVDNKRQSFIFGSALTDLFRRRLDVVPRGYSGYCSEHARYIVDDVIAGIGSGIKLVTIFFGSNDASKDPNQCVPIARYSDNIKYVVERFQAVGAKVILVGPALHDEVHRNQIFKGSDPSLNPRSTLRNLEYSNAAKELAGSLDIPFIDLWHTFLYSVGWEEGKPIPGKLAADRSNANTDSGIKHLLNDGLHFTGQGYELWFRELEKVIENKFPEFVPENMPFQYPDFGQDLIKLTPQDAEEIFKNHTLPHSRY